MPQQHQPERREPLAIEQDHITVGKHTAAVAGDDRRDLLCAYLRLVRRARGEWRHRKIAVRRADITILAEHLGWSEQRVLSELADQVGSTRRQRAAMFAILATGASLITISEPAAAAGDTGIGTSIAPPIVVEAPDLQGLKTNPHGAAQHDPASVAPGQRGSERPTAAPVEPDAPAEQTEVSTSAPIEQVGTPPATPLVEQAAPPPITTDSPEITVAVDTVESAAATEMASETGAVGDAQVAVGTPPVPPATDDDGNAVAVGQPPVPPAVDDGGNAVAVGQPPVPPAPPVADG